MTSLADFYTQYNNNRFDPNSQGAQDFLSRIKQYDPNARMEIMNDGDTGNQIGNFVFDRNSLPLNPTGQRGFNQYQPMYDFEKYHNRDLKWDDPVYGKGTDTRNVIPDKPKGFDRYFPMAVTAMLGAMGGAAIGPLLGGGATGSFLYGAGRQGLSQLYNRQQQQSASNRQRGFSQDMNTRYRNYLIQQYRKRTGGDKYGN